MSIYSFSSKLIVHDTEFVFFPFEMNLFFIEKSFIVFYTWQSIMLSVIGIRSLTLSEPGESTWSEFSLDSYDFSVISLLSERIKISVNPSSRLLEKVINTEN